MADSFGWGIKPFHQLIDSLHGGELIALRMVDGHAETVSGPFCVLLWVPYAGVPVSRRDLGLAQRT